MPIHVKPKKGGSCPLCGQPSAVGSAPFCSPRCRDRDLLNWLGDGYRIPGPPADPDALVEALDSRREPPL
jgi:endogenous inhibitor of DNA gyrase (YacG/DUF329 family)